MIKIFEIKYFNKTERFIYQKTGRNLNIFFKHKKEPTKILNNSILEFEYEIESILDDNFQNRIIGFKNKINSNIVSIEEYHKLFPNEVIDVSRYEFINPSWNLSQFHKEHKLEKETFYKSFGIPKIENFEISEREFSIKPIILDDDSIAFKGILNLENYDSLNSLNLKAIYSYDFKIVQFELSIQLETLKLVQKDLNILDGLKTGIEALRMLKI